MASKAEIPPLTSNPAPAAGAGLYGLRALMRSRLAAVLIGALSVATIGLLAILAATGMSLEAEFGRFVLLALMLVALAGYCRYRRHDWRLTDSASVTACVTLGLLLCGLISTIGLRAGFPIADAALARADGLVGFDVRHVALWTASQPTASWLLNLAYNSSGPLCAAAVLWCLFARDRVRMWQVVATIVVAMQVTALVSMMFPALGATAFFGLDTLHGRGLPFGAGTYSVAEFSHFYSGSETVARLEDMNGIVTFPSFHTVMALVILQGFAASPFRWIALGWSALTIVSTVPMGGHYVVDLAGGLVVWLTASALAEWATRPLATEARPMQPVQPA